MRRLYTVISQTAHVYQQNAHFDNEFSQSRNTHQTQQAVLHYNDIYQKGSLRDNLYQLWTKSNVDS